METRKILTIVVLALGLVACWGEVSKAADMGTAFTYQGRFLDENKPAEGLYDFQFKLFDDPNANFPLAEVNVSDIDVTDGYFTAALDFNDPNAFNGEARWLEIGVRPGAGKDPFTILSPRQQVTPTPYALYAASGPGVPVPLELSGSVAYPGAVIKGTNTGTGRGVYGKHNTSGNYGYLGHSDRGVYGYSSSDYGVRGHGGSYGAYGSTSDGYGVYGKHNNSGNHGDLGSSTYGAYGRHSRTGNHGCLGYKGGGVYGHSISGSYGVYGSSSSGGYGVYGSSSSSGCGVGGQNNTNGNYGYLGGYNNGVYGEHKSSGNFGYIGTLDYGVGGRSDAGYGVFGASSSGYAGYFDGNVYVTNNVSALSFTDRTPYPKDLATAYQSVMSMERSPDGQYDENNEQVQLDHSKLSDFIKSEDGNRDLSATVSCQNEVLKDVVRRLEEKEQLTEELYTHNRQLQEQLAKMEMRLDVMQNGSF
ncbi:MAG: hypothetical protein ACYTEQ_25895 [Planctomycetota bacterium]|jgi:hypothetical protein